MKRFTIRFALLLILLLSIISGCGQQSQQGGSQTAKTQTQVDPASMIVASTQEAARKVQLLQLAEKVKQQGIEAQKQELLKLASNPVKHWGALTEQLKQLARTDSVSGLTELKQGPITLGKHWDQLLKPKNEQATSWPDWLQEQLSRSAGQPQSQPN